VPQSNIKPVNLGDRGDQRDQRDQRDHRAV
jgi:hypothetical protein